MRLTYFWTFAAAGAMVYAGCDDMDATLDPTEDRAPTVVEPANPTDPVPPAAQPLDNQPPTYQPPATEPTTGDLGTQPGDVPGARAGDPNLATPSAADPTNTGLNERDAVDAPPPLPTDQEATGPGMELTAKIRSEITSTDGMSINARNVKIVTEGNTVTLRGPVQSEEEKQTIDRIAREAAGESYTVVNMLEVQRDR